MKITWPFFFLTLPTHWAEHTKRRDYVRRMTPLRWWWRKIKLMIQYCNDITDNISRRWKKKIICHIEILKLYIIIIIVIEQTKTKKYKNRWIVIVDVTNAILIIDLRVIRFPSRGKAQSNGLRLWFGVLKRGVWFSAIFFFFCHSATRFVCFSL